MKRYLALFLSLVMILCALPTAFAEDIENPYEDEGVVIYRDADGNVIDLGGMEIIVADWWSTDWHDDNPTTDAGEATYDYRTWLEETYNFTIVQKNVTTWGDSPSDFTNFATTGGDENYVWLLRADAALAPYKAGLFYDLSTLDCLNFSDEKWNETTGSLYSKPVTDEATGESHIGVFAMRPEKAEPRKGVFFNYRLLSEAGIDPESIYDMQADGTWTWDAFEALCEKLTRDTDNDGVTDRYAMMSFSSHLLPAAAVSNGAGFVMVDENGLFYNGAETDAFLEAMNWVIDLIGKYEMKAPEGANWDYFQTAFINGEVALQVHEEYFVSSLQEMEDDFGFVFFPKGPQSDTYLFAPSDNVMVIPACYDADRAWKIAFAYNLYTNPTPGYGETDDWKTDYKKLFRDERSVDDTLAMMRDPVHQFTWYSDMVTGYDLGSQYIWNVYALAETPAEKAESMRGTWQAYLDEANGLGVATTTAE